MLQLEAVEELHKQLVLGLTVQDSIELFIQLIVLGEDDAGVRLLVLLLEVQNPVELVCDVLVVKDDAVARVKQELLEVRVFEVLIAVGLHKLKHDASNSLDAVLLLAHFLEAPDSLLADLLVHSLQLFLTGSVLLQTLTVVRVCTELAAK
jgi:hypothetical protein